MALENTVALITGATGELGPAVTEAFLGAGARVFATYLHEERKEALLSRIGRASAGLTLFQADVTTEAGAQRAADAVIGEAGRIDVLAALVGGFLGGTPIAESPLTDLEKMLHLNLYATFLACKAVVPIMIAQGSGRIITIGSRNSAKMAANFGPSAISKIAVHTLTSVLAEEVKNHGITVNAVLPGTIDTPTNRIAMPKADFSKWVAPGAVAQVILTLASPETAAVNGALIPVGGRQ